MKSQHQHDPKMTILIYDYQELQEQTSSRLKTWKAWHTTLFILTAIFGMANYTFLQNTMQMVDGHCALYPRELTFHRVQLPLPRDAQEFDLTKTGNDGSKRDKRSANEENALSNSTHTVATNATDGGLVSNVTAPPEKSNETTKKPKYQVPIVIEPSVNVTTTEEHNGTILSGNMMSVMVLNTNRTLFSDYCDVAEYMPIMSTIVAVLWAVMFIMCPAGGRTRSGLTQPWRILAPALLVALVFVGLTGLSFVRTNGGLQDFCGAFQNFTNSTTCSSVNPWLARTWNTSWSFSGRVAATRATAAGVWALWACAAALLLARCLAAPDFVVKNTGVYLVKDPKQKVTPHLRRSPRRSQRSVQSTPSKADASTRSEPTATTELVTASVEREDSAPTSVTASPMKMDHPPPLGEAIELAYSPKELNRQR